MSIVTTPKQNEYVLCSRPKIQYMISQHSTFNISNKMPSKGTPPTNRSADCMHFVKSMFLKMCGIYIETDSFQLWHRRYAMCLSVQRMVISCVALPFVRSRAKSSNFQFVTLSGQFFFCMQRWRKWKAHVQCFTHLEHCSNTRTQSSKSIFELFISIWSK